MTLPTLFEMPGGGWAYRDPEYTWFDPTGPTGIAFPHGSTFGHAYDNTLLFADFNENQIYAMPLNGSRDGFDLVDKIAETQAELDTFALISNFPNQPVATEFGPDGSLYVVNYFGGIIHKITGPRSLGAEVPSIGGGLLAFLALALSAVGLLFVARTR
jgi:glucose/arabinose dehydrogenase